jgi:hypothetical protein
MPSIHVGWAVLFVLAVWPTGSRTARVLAATHAVVTSYVVMVTGNHFWSDGFVGAALAAGAVVIATRRGRMRAWLLGRAHGSPRRSSWPTPSSSSAWTTAPISSSRPRDAS